MWLVGLPLVRRDSDEECMDDEERRDGRDELRSYEVRMPEGILRDPNDPEGPENP
jgi:hypothetical protein